jgi:TPR repeat protein
MGMLGDLILSARIAGVVMNFPLYDGGVSEKARRLIADGRLDEALEEYRRLAELGSGLAKCVLAYLNLRDLPRTPRDVTGAKILANAALNSEPGYANYVLAYVAAFEKNAPKAIDLMCKSHKAKFIPAASALGLILGQGYGTSKDPKKAETFLLRASFSRHIPAPMLLCRFYLRGDCGLAKWILGLLFFPFAFVYAWIGARFLIFSVYTFRHFNVSVPPMFNERALRARTAT